MYLKKIKNYLIGATHTIRMSAITIRRSRIEELQKMRLSKSPKGISGYGYKVYSQSDEDGIVANIFSRIGYGNKVFVEFGVGDGLENNTAALLHDGWSGLWIEGSKDYCDKIKFGMKNLIDSGRLTVVNAFIYPDNIDTLISSSLSENEIDLLSVDIDGNDAYVIENISCINPRVIIVEYNAKFGPSLSFCIKYNRDHVWQKSDNFGASLKYFENMFRERGYSLVGCNVVGTNAFFVRDDLLGDMFEGPYTSEKHFEPARYELVGLPSGHPSSYASFSTSI